MRLWSLIEPGNEAVDVHGDIGQGVVGNQIEGDIGIAKCKIEIDKRCVVLRVLGQATAEVDGEAGTADAAARADHGDDKGFDLGIALHWRTLGPTFGPTNASRDVPALPHLFETLIDAPHLTRQNGKTREHVTRLEIAETPLLIPRHGCLEADTSADQEQ